MHFTADNTHLLNKFKLNDNAEELLFSYKLNFTIHKMLRPEFPSIRDIYFLRSTSFLYYRMLKLQVFKNTLRRLHSINQIYTNIKNLSKRLFWIGMKF